MRVEKHVTYIFYHDQEIKHNKKNGVIFSCLGSIKKSIYSFI